MDGSWRSTSARGASGSRSATCRARWRGRSETIAVTSEADAVERVARRIDELGAEDDGLGDDRRRDADAASTARRRRRRRASPRSSKRLKGRTSLTIATEDERLTSREAESRLAVARARLAKAQGRSSMPPRRRSILQDYLDRV